MSLRCRQRSFRHPVTKLCDRSMRGTTGDGCCATLANVPDDVRHDIEATAPMSFQQQWMASGKLRHPNPGWNMLLPWRLTGPVDHGALLAAVDAVIARHG